MKPNEAEALFKRAVSLYKKIGFLEERRTRKNGYKIDAEIEYYYEQINTIKEALDFDGYTLEMVDSILTMKLEIASSRI